MQIDGAEVVGWASKATSEELTLLANAEYSDANDIWIIKASNRSGLLVVKDGHTQQLLRPYGFFRSGTFFLNDDIGTQLSQRISDSLSQGDKDIAEANAYLGTRGFFVSELGGTSQALLLAHAIKNFEENNEIPDLDNWERIHELLVNGKASIMRCGAKFVLEWVVHSERQNEGIFDVYRRVLLATLCRHTGQLDKALEASDIVDLPRERLNGGSSTISVLCTTRAATMMDISELQPSRKNELLLAARRTLNKANAMAGGDSEEIMVAYRRLKSLDSNL